MTCLHVIADPPATLPVERSSWRRHGSMAIAGICVALSAGLARASGPEQLAAEFLQLSCLDSHLQGTGPLLASKVMTGPTWIPVGERDALDRALREAFSPDRVNRAALGYLVERMDPELAQAALAWLRTPEMRGVVRLEDSHAAPDFEIRRDAWAQTQRIQGPSAERVALARRIEVASQATHTAANLRYLVGIAILNGRNAAAGYPARPEVLSRDLQRSISSGYEEIDREAMISILYMFRSLTDGELSRYAEALESATGQWYARTVNHALKGATGVAARALAERFSAELKTRRERWE